MKTECFSKSNTTKTLFNSIKKQTDFDREQKKVIKNGTENKKNRNTLTCQISMKEFFCENTRHICLTPSP